MKVIEKFLYEYDGKNVNEYTIDNENGLVFSILNLGGTITEIKTKDKFGNLENIVLKYDDMRTYIENPSYYGATVGRTAGRINDGYFTLNSEIYQLAKNYGKNSGHGGERGFSNRIFDVDIIEKNESVIVSLSYFSKDLEEGYPGNLNIKVEYEVRKDNKIIFRVLGKSDKDTLLNITNHSYFNLSGNYKRDILDHSLKMNCDRYLEIDTVGGATGEVLEAKDEFDFRKGKLLGKDIDSETEQIKLGAGFDHPFLFEEGNENLIELFDEESGRKMVVKTDYPAVVIYSQNYIDGQILDGGKDVKRRMAVCLEVQNPPIGYNESFKDYSILKKDEEVLIKTEYSFFI